MMIGRKMKKSLLTTVLKRLLQIRRTVLNIGTVLNPRQSKSLTTSINFLVFKFDVLELTLVVLYYCSYPKGLSLTTVTCMHPLFQAT